MLDNGKLRVEQVELYANDDAEDVSRWVWECLDEISILPNVVDRGALMFIITEWSCH